MEQTVRYMLFEDEYYTSINIKTMIAALRPNYQLVGESETVQKAAAIMSSCDADLIISSMQLADGCCLEAFRHAGCRKPAILMAESYDKNLQSQVNLVACLLKPVSQGSIRMAITRFEKNINH